MYIQNLSKEFKKLSKKFNKNNNNSKNDIINMNSLNNVYGEDKNKVNSLTKKLVEACNNILVNNEEQCQCYDNKKYPSRNHKGVKSKNNT